MSHILHLLAISGIYAIAVLSLDLLLTHLGLISLAHVALMLVGAYTYAGLCIDAGVGVGPAIFGALLLGGIGGWLLGLLTRRVRGEGFILSTFAVHLVVIAAAQAWIPVTGGPAGRPGVPPILGGSVSPARFALVSLGLAGVWWGVLRYLKDTTLMRLAHVFREDERLLSLLGYDPEKIRLRFSTFAGAGAGLAGGLYVAYVQYVEPLSFSLVDSVLLVTAIVVGGMGSWRGNLFGVLLIVLVPELLREVGMPITMAAQLRQGIFGILLVGAVLLRPSGVFGDRQLAERVLLR